MFDTYVNTNLRYSQVAPLDMFTEKNTGNNLPAQFDIYATKGKRLSEHLLEHSCWKLWSINALIFTYSKKGNEYHFHFMAKGGGSANKTFLYQETKALLNPDKLRAFLEKNVKTIGTAACPPYHLGIGFFAFCSHASSRATGALASLCFPADYVFQ